MKLKTFQYIKNKGWNVDSFPQMDSEQTLIFAFASPSFINELAPLQELSKHYPKSKIIGCSTAGEIAGASIMDDSISVAIAQFEKTQLKIVKMEVSAVEESSKVGESVANQLNAPRTCRHLSR